MAGERRASLTFKGKDKLFDAWPDQYDRWFETPIGSVVKTSELDLVMELLAPAPGEFLLDAGCGTGVFTLDILASGASAVGVDLSFPMIDKAARKWRLLSPPFMPMIADMAALPFKDGSFDKTVSITALEFIEDAKRAVTELFRVTKRKGLIVVATLNSLSPWAARRRKEAEEKETVFSKAVFRSPEEMLALAPLPGIVKTAVHFSEGIDAASAMKAEEKGRKENSETGAFVAVRWQKP